MYMYTSLGCGRIVWMCLGVTGARCKLSNNWPEPWRSGRENSGVWELPNEQREHRGLGSWRPLRHNQFITMSKDGRVLLGCLRPQEAGMAAAVAATPVTSRQNPLFYFSHFTVEISRERTAVTDLQRNRTKKFSLRITTQANFGLYGYIYNFFCFFPVFFKGNWRVQHTRTMTLFPSILRPLQR